MGLSDQFLIDNRSDYYDALSAARDPQQQERALNDLHEIKGYPDIFAEAPAIGGILGGMAGTAAAFPAGKWLATRPPIKSAFSNLALRTADETLGHVDRAVRSVDDFTGGIVDLKQAKQGVFDDWLNQTDEVFGFRPETRADFKKEL